LHFTFLGTIRVGATVLNKNSLKNGHPGRSTSFTGSEKQRQREIGGKMLKTPENKIGNVRIS